MSRKCNCNAKTVTTLPQPLEPVQAASQPAKSRKLKKWNGLGRVQQWRRRRLLSNAVKKANEKVMSNLGMEDANVTTTLEVEGHLSTTYRKDVADDVYRDECDTGKWGYCKNTDRKVNHSLSESPRSNFNTHPFIIPPGTMKTRSDSTYICSTSLSTSNYYFRIFKSLSL